MSQPNALYGIRIGAHYHDKLRFPEAARIVETYVKTEQTACERLVKKINEESFLASSASWWSEVLGRVKPPAYADWIQPITTLASGQSAWNGGLAEAAGQYLGTAVRQYNDVHRKWVDYRNGLDKGAKRAVLVMELTVTAATTVFGAPQGAGTLARAGVGAAWKLYSESAKATGLVAQDVEKELDLTKVLASTVSEFAANFTAGALSKKFLDIFYSRCFTGMAVTGPSGTRYVSVSVKDALKAGAYKIPGLDKPKIAIEFLTGVGVRTLNEAIKNAALKARGRGATVGQFMEMVVQEISATETWKQFLRTSLRSVPAH